jgi:hypothetical protein
MDSSCAFRQKNPSISFVTLQVEIGITSFIKLERQLAGAMSGRQTDPLFRSPIRHLPNWQSAAISPSDSAVAARQAPCCRLLAAH